MNIKSFIKIITNLILIFFLFISNLVIGQEKSTRTELLKQRRLEKAKSLHSYKPGKIEKLLLFIEVNPFEEILKNGYKGFHPIIGGMKGGAGTSAGIRFEPTDNIQNLHFALQANASLKSYQDYKAALGYEDKKWSIFSFAQHRISPQENFYGLGINSSKDNRCYFKMTDTNIGGLISYKAISSLRATMQSSYLTNKQIGTNQEEHPSIEEIYNTDEIPGLETDTDFFVTSAKLTFDFRDVDYGKNVALKQAFEDNPFSQRGANPSTGTLLSLKASHYKTLSDHQFDFNQLDIELQQFFSFFYASRVIAMRSFFSLVDLSEGSEVPFYFMNPLGGSMSLRGYPEFRFRDRNTFLLNVEYRWMAWMGLDIALFYDTGKVFPDANKFDFKNLKSDYGIGLRFNTDSSVYFRVDIARSKEGIQLITKFSNIF